MSKPTLLDMTQEILSAMSSDEVNSISDTTESLQVAYILKRKFLDIAARSGLSDYYDLFKLDPSGDVTKPTLMTLPDEIAKVDWIKYWNSNSGSTDVTVPVPGYGYVNILSIGEFIDMVNQFNPSETNVASYDLAVDINGVTETYTFYYKNDAQPTNCCILGNNQVLFDSYDNTQDSTLQQTKSMGYGKYSPYWSMTDAFIPELDEEQFPLLIAEAKTLAFFELKQQPHSLAMQESKRQWSTVSKNKLKSQTPSDFDQLSNFGRQGSLYSLSNGVFK